MSFFRTPPVVVGYDGSTTARAALMLAAGEAARRGLRLRVVHVQETGWDPLLDGHRPVLPTSQQAADPLAEAVELVRPLIATSQVTICDRLGVAAAVLCAQAEGAELLVVGRGEPGLLGYFAGSVAIEVACKAPCPVMIVGDAGPQVPHTGPVIAGIEREHADEVLDAAFHEADLRRCELVVVNSWHQLHWLGPDGVESLAVSEVARESDEQWLRDVVARFQRKYPRVAVTEALREGRAAAVLIESSAAATLVVVGTSGRGPVAGLILGSVGQKLLRHARCPVMIVRS